MELPVGVGDLVAGKYRVEERIGSGAMGVVFAARHVELGERVALKFLNPIYGESEEARSRFSREAKNTFSLKSEHVARVLDVGKLDSGDPFIVMEFLDGRTLRAHVEENGRLPRDESVSIVHQICEGVADAHTRGIVHRDLKPENVFLTKLASGSSLVKVLDFGISKLTEESRIAARKEGVRSGSRELAITAQDQILGTPRFMAPEQVRTSGTASTASDVWSVGVIAYWLLCGEYPYDGGSSQLTLVKLLSEENAKDIATLVPDLDPALARMVMKCLDRTVANRFEDADALRRAIRPFARASVAMTRREPTPPTQRSALGLEVASSNEPASPRVVEAVVAPETIRETDRMPTPSEHAEESVPLDLAAILAARNPGEDAETKSDANKKPSPVDNGVGAAAPAQKAAVDARTTQRRITLKASDASAPKPMPAGVAKERSRTLPLGMVYSTSTSEPPRGATPSESPPPEVTQEVPLDAPDQIPMRRAGRMRIVLVLGFFAFIFVIVWMLKTR